MNSDFLFTDDFISSANKNFDTVLFEHTFKEEDFDFLGAISYHTRREKKLLVVVEKTPVDIIFPLIQRWKAKVTIINPSCWMPGFANKWFWDMRDITKARDFWLHVMEPLYQEQILDFLENNDSCYIRVNEHIPFKEQIPNIKIDKNGFYNFQEHGYSWTHWTLICFWTVLIDSLYATWYLQKEWHAFDVFSSINYFFTISKQLEESLKKTEKLIVIIDQHLWSLYDIWMMSNFSKLWLKNLSITFITPYYQHINSLSDEYMYEQAKFDWITIAERIKEE